MELYISLFFLGLFGGFISGLLGIGGGIIMVPLLLYVPPAIGAAALGMKTVAGITSVQSFVGAASGAIGHQRFKRINARLVLLMGISMSMGALAGSVASTHVSANTMLFIFAGMALAASILMFIPRPESDNDPTADSINFNQTLAVVSGLILGVLSGLIGQGGAFLFIPVMIYLLHIPTRIAIGSALAIGILSSIAVLIGRIGTSQIPYLMSTILVTGVVFGAQIGSIVSQRTPRAVLKRILAVLIAITAIKIWYELLFINPTYS